VWQLNKKWKSAAVDKSLIIVTSSADEEGITKSPAKAIYLKSLKKYVRGTNKRNSI
jgi:hypothetical protein